ncbi:hypothetical protein MTR_7g066140 [Medicago truncatula]|uniref:Uncharacterized protein n=1 Tax=Medicago truncatula TaxID=3880 RepID=A0A072TZX6_MEDTR|nr:hypothetical protein MTR_7g066140 [Medicago truncatula]
MDVIRNRSSRLEMVIYLLSVVVANEMAVKLSVAASQVVGERILDGLSLAAKEIGLELIRYKNTSPPSQKLGTTRARLGTAVPPPRTTFAAFA